MRSLKEMFELTDKGSKDLKKATIASAAANISLMLPVWLMLMVVIELTNPFFGKTANEMNVVLYTAAAVVLVVVIYAVHHIQYNECYVSAYNESANRRIRLAESLRKLPLSFFGKRDLADLTSTLMGDATALETTFSHTVPQFFGSLLSLLIVGIFMFVFDWRMAISMLAALPISMILLFGTKRIQDRLSRKAIKASVVSADGIQECLEGIKVVKGYNMEEKIMLSLNDKFNKVYKAQIRAELITGIFVSAAQLVLRIGMALVIMVGTYLLSGGQLEIVTFLLFLLIASRIYDPLSTAMMHIAEIFNMGVRIERMKEINEYPVQEGSTECSPSGYDIEFKDVVFSYDENEVLHGVTFTAKQGEVTALVGPSGSGKSTMTKLAARFWDVDSGEISMGGTNVNSIEPETLLENYAIVFQDVVLFNDTIMNNIRIGKKNATEKEIIEAAKNAQCEDFVNRLPDGYNTVIGENGHTLSGGERQRISIARALLKDAPVILLDEATASLDAGNETKIQEAISNLVRDKTVIVVAHRMRTVEGADKIVVMKDGIIVEEGTHEDMMQKDGLYRRMVGVQRRNAEWTLNTSQ